MESNATDKPVPREITALLSDERLILRETHAKLLSGSSVAARSKETKVSLISSVVGSSGPNSVHTFSNATAFVGSGKLGREGSVDP
jgi:hypothetical protein